MRKSWRIPPRDLLLIVVAWTVPCWYFSHTESGFGDFSQIGLGAPLLYALLGGWAFALTRDIWKEFWRCEWPNKVMNPTKGFLAAIVFASAFTSMLATPGGNGLLLTDFDRAFPHYLLGTSSGFLGIWLSLRACARDDEKRFFARVLTPLREALRKDAASRKTD